MTTKRTQEDDEGDDGEGDEGDEVKEHMSMCRHRAERRPDRHGNSQQKYTSTMSVCRQNGAVTQLYDDEETKTTTTTTTEDDDDDGGTSTT